MKKICFTIVLVLFLLPLVAQASDDFERYGQCTFEFDGGRGGDARYHWNMSMNKTLDPKASEIVLSKICSWFPNSHLKLSDTIKETNDGKAITIVVNNSCSFKYVYKIEGSNIASSSNYQKCQEKSRARKSHGGVESIKRQSTSGTASTVICNDRSWGVVDTSSLGSTCASGNEISPKCDSWTVPTAAEYICK